MNTYAPPKGSASGGKNGHVPIFSIRPSPENEQLYRPVDPNDPDILALAESIKRDGILEPLVVTRDGFIISGHRRYAAAKIAGLQKVPCRKINITRGSPEFLKLLREHNRQRIKTRDEILREEIASIDPEDAHCALSAHRREKSRIAVDTIEVRTWKGRAAISPAKEEFLCAVERILTGMKDYLPLNNRQIFYQLINDPPLIHSSKPNSRFRNDLRSYKALCDLLTRARHEGRIPYDWIDDATRPVTVWQVHPNVSAYYRQELKDILNGYWRNLMQSQPNHIEIVAEKNTLQNVLSPVAMEYCIPLTIGRGQCSTPPLSKIAKRFEDSGKEELIIIAVSDLDPDGDEIAHSLARRLRWDFCLFQNVEVIKAALTMEQAEDLELPKSFERAKRTSSNYERYIDRHGTDAVYELEAVAPHELQGLLRDTIDSVIDIDAYNHEVDEEKRDAAFNAANRERVLKVLQEQIRE